jgi:hypothetical protein
VRAESSGELAPEPAWLLPDVVVPVTQDTERTNVTKLSSLQSIEVQLKLIDMGWEAAKRGHVDSNPQAVPLSLVQNFREALDGLTKAYEAAGAAEK